jgi:hypothetical protein
MPDRFYGTFTSAQTKQLLEPINPVRVLKDGKQNSHVSHQDIVAHLTRIFGFGNWGTELLSIEPVFETCHGEATDPKARWTVGYRAVLALTVYDEQHNPVTMFQDASIGDAQNLVRQDAHDLAMKSAISLALKRCAKNLGDQFGLSLYNKGQMAALVRGTLVLPKNYAKEIEAPVEDMQEGIPEQVALGHDEVEKKSEPTPEQTAQIDTALPAAEPKEEEGISKAQHAKIGALLTEVGAKTREEAIARVVSAIGVDVKSRNDLTKAQAHTVIESLEAERAEALVKSELGGTPVKEEQA